MQINDTAWTSTHQLANQGPCHLLSRDVDPNSLEKKRLLHDYYQYPDPFAILHVHGHGPAEGPDPSGPAGLNLHSLHSHALPFLEKSSQDSVRGIESQCFYISLNGYSLQAESNGCRLAVKGT